VGYTAIPRPARGVRGNDHGVLGKTMLHKLLKVENSYVNADAYGLLSSLKIHFWIFKDVHSAGAADAASSVAVE
jgi:hypothetical protein